MVSSARPDATREEEVKALIRDFGRELFLSKVSEDTAASVITFLQGLKIGTQSEKTKRWEFILCAVMPTITGALGVIPKLFWPIDRKKRAQMYFELSEHRNSMVSAYMDNLL